jgi:translation initiation factor IF-3
LKQNEKFYRVNERIRFSPVMVVDQNGQKLGVMPTDEARKKARLADMDLVEVAPSARPPVCRIMDYGKFKYEQTIKEKKQKTKQKTNLLKELRLSPRIADHDILTKSNVAKRFLEDGFRVQFRLEYKRRENAHKDLGFDVMKKILEYLEEVGVPERTPVLQGNVLTCLIAPKGKKDECDRSSNSTTRDSEVDVNPKHSAVS